jgi:DNA/RNA endonuclease YhcR with UshA esterase domain
MKIQNVNVKVSVVTLGMAGFFTLILIAYLILSGDWRNFLWGIASVILLVILAAGLNYMSQRQYADLVPVYEKEAKKISIRAINLGLMNKPVRIEGVVERVHLSWLNRPQFLVADRTGEISVKMFTNPSENIKKGDVVEVLGSVIKRYILSGDAVINCVSIRKIDKKSQDS